MSKSTQKKKIPLWKRTQEEKKKKKALQLSGLLFLTLFSALGFKSLNFLAARINLSLENQKCFIERTDLKKANRVNIVFDGEPLLIASFDQAEQTISALAIPKDFYLKKETEVYRLGSFFELGEMRDGCGGRFLKRELLRFLSLPIDRYVKISGDGWSVSSQEEMEAGIKKIQGWEWFLKSVVNFRGMREGFETDLSPLEIFKLWRQLKGTREDKIFFRSLSREIALEEDQLVDGTKIEVIASDLFFEEAAGFFKDSFLKQEGVEVAVFNTTSSPGLGQKGSRLVVYLGAELTHVGNWPEKMEKTQIWVVEKEVAFSRTLKRLADVFQAEVVTDPEVAEPRGELMILLGQDWQRWLF